MGLVPFIDMYTDPDAINQLIIKMVIEREIFLFQEFYFDIQCQQIPLTIENFLLVARTTDSRAELSTLAERIDIEISRWRSKDTGGENGNHKRKESNSSKIFNILDADIRATLNSYHYLKRLLSERLEKQAPIMVFVYISV